MKVLAVSKACRLAGLLALVASCAKPTDSARLEEATLIVLDSAREAPLAGVRVTMPDGTTVETDATGACRLLGRQHTWIQVHLEKPGYGHGVESLAWTREMEAYLAPLLELGGRVLAEETGEPVAGARLTLERVQCPSCAPATAVSDRDGRYALVAGGTDLQLGRISVVAPGFARSTTNPQPSFGVVPREHDFVLRRGLELTGRVVDFETGAGLAGAEVDGISTDESGGFSVRVLPAQGFVELSVRAEGHCRLWARIPSAEVERHEPVHLPLVRGTTLGGTLRDAEGRILTGVDVWLDGPALDPGARNSADAERPEPLRALPAGWRFELDSDAPWSPARTDAEGRFRFEGLPPWSRLRLLAGDGRSLSAEQELEPLGGPGESTRAELTLAPTPGPAPDATVIAIEIRVNGFEANLPGVFSWKGRTRAGRVVSKGEFQTQVEGGELALHVELDDFPGPLPGDEAVLTHLGGFHPHVIDVRVPSKPIAGRVRFEDGPALRVKVRARCTPPRSNRSLTAEVRTDPEGRFHFDAPDLGAPYEVSVLLGEAGRVVEVEPGTETLDFDLRRPGAILLGVTDAASGQELPLTEMEFWWKLVGDTRLQRVRDSWGLRRTNEGLYWLRVPNGELEIEAWPRSEELCPSRGRRVLVPADGGPVRVELALERGVELTLRLDEACGPASGSWLLLEESARNAVRRYRSQRDEISLGYERVDTQPFVLRPVLFDAAGSAVVRGLTPGPHCLRLFPGDPAIEPETIQVSATRSEPVVVRWCAR